MLKLSIFARVQEEVKMPEPLRLYIAPDGNDSWSGSLPSPNESRTDGPFATLERARDEIRKLKEKGLPYGGVSVELRGGIHWREHPFRLTEEDSGTSQSPIVYRAYQDEPVRISGGKPIKNFEPVGDPDTLETVHQSVRSQLLQADLRQEGVTDFGSVNRNRLELFFDDEPMTLARYPNEGFLEVVDVAEYDGLEFRGIKGSSVGKIIYEGERPQRWLQEKDPWLHGYWFWNWAAERQKIVSINTENRIITLAPPPHRYGYRKGQWFYAFNMLCELDRPGEWYLDREKGILYFYPPSPLEGRSVLVSLSPALVLMRGTSYISFENLTFEVTRGNALSISGGSHIKIDHCTIRNTGAWAIIIMGGEDNAVLNCHIYHTGGGGIKLFGGDRASLTPARHLAHNNHIHHYARWDRMYRPAISLQGVGCTASHNLIHDAPHQAIAFAGNDHLIEFNEIHSVCTESNDAGAIYSGRDWTWRGNIIRYNFFRDITGFREKGCVGAYLDDMLCGTLIYGNIFLRVTRATLIGGGRDNIIENNIFIDCEPALHIDARAMGWASHWINTTMTERLLSMPYNQPPWTERYPELLTILEDEPSAPKGNIVRRNICCGGRWAEVRDKARPFITIEDNLIEHTPQSLGLSTTDFSLRDDSPALSLGFKPIPFSEIGLLD